METQANNMSKGDSVLSRTGEKGIFTGGTRFCVLEGCTGRRYGVRWPDNKLTFPCSKGMIWNDADGVWQIR